MAALKGVEIRDGDAKQAFVAPSADDHGHPRLEIRANERAHHRPRASGLDGNGYCNIVGRVKDMLIRGGENVYPREVEEFLFTHPAVAQAQVFGVPDSKYGEEVCAWIVLNPGVAATAATEADIRAFCRDRIAHYKTPRYLRFVNEIAMTVTGKAQKFIMREQMVAELGLSEAATG